MNLIDIARELGTEEECFAFLEKQRWPNGVRCTVCGGERISRITRKAKSKNVRKNLYQCLEPSCKQQFSVTSGTIFHDSRVPLTKWFAAINLIMDAKKGMSAMQLQRHLGLGSYETAWHMAHRIRRAMMPSEKTMMYGTVEMDETFIGAQQVGHQHKPGHPDCKKLIVVGLRQRGGDTRLFHAQDATSGTLAQYIKDNVHEDVDAIMTDEYNAYPGAMKATGLTARHKTIKHKAKIYVDGDIHTNGIESAFSLFKRGLVGSFHHVSAKHLHRYLAEFDHRFNRRKLPTRFTDLVMRSGQASPLPYRELIGK